ncbi:glycine/betaine ABC transporter, partial [Halobacteriales archaeon QS_1_68_17]
LPRREAGRRDATGGGDGPCVNQRIFWAVTEGAVAAVLLVGGGLGALQTASITTGVPFAFVLLLMCYTVWTGLKREYEILEFQEFADWMERVAREEEIDWEETGVPSDVAPGDD